MLAQLKTTVARAEAVIAEKVAYASHVAAVARKKERAGGDDGGGTEADEDEEWEALENENTGLKEKVTELETQLVCVPITPSSSSFSLSLQGYAF